MATLTEFVSSSFLNSTQETKSTHLSTAQASQKLPKTAEDKWHRRIHNSSPKQQCQSNEKNNITTLLQKTLQIVRYGKTKYKVVAVDVLSKKIAFVDQCSVLAFLRC